MARTWKRTPSRLKGVDLRKGRNRNATSLKAGSQYDAGPRVALRCDAIRNRPS